MQVIKTKCTELVNMLRQSGLRVEEDSRENYKPGWKYNYWELKGVPIRIEIGNRDIANNGVTYCRRDNLGVKDFLSNDGLADNLKAILDDIHNNLFAKAKALSDERRVRATTLEEFAQKLNGNAVLVPFCETAACEDMVKNYTETQTTVGESDATFELTGKAKSLCIPFDNPELPENTKCFACDNMAKSWTYFGRSY